MTRWESKKHVNMRMQDMDMLMADGWRILSVHYIPKGPNSSSTMTMDEVIWFEREARFIPDGPPKLKVA